MKKPCVGVCLVWLLGASVAGCAGPDGVGAWRGPRGPDSPSASDVVPDPACTTLAKAGALNREEAEALLPDAAAAFRADRSPGNRLWALLLLLRAEPREFRDAWALEVLDASSTDAASEARQRGVETLLGDVFAERLLRAAALRRAEAESQGAQELARNLQNFLDEVRDALRVATERGVALRAERDEALRKEAALGSTLEGERRRAAELQAQLDQLKAIEKILDRRDVPPPLEGVR